MQELRKKIILEQERLKRIEEKVIDELENAPEGALRISKSNNRIQYYHFIKGCNQKNGKYMNKSDGELIYKLAQKSYNEKVLLLVKRRLKQINKLVEEYQDDEIEMIYKKETSDRRRLILPVEIPWEERLNQWMAEEYKYKQFNESDPIIFTEKGERVRSKTEKIIADYLFHENISYKYEKELKLKGYGVVYPDFTFLSKKTGEEIYWEHEGRMDDPIYVESAIKKITTYERNGIYPGERLILTFETRRTILNTSDIDRIVKKYLK